MKLNITKTKFRKDRRYPGWKIVDPEIIGMEECKYCQIWIKKSTIVLERKFRSGSKWSLISGTKKYLNELATLSAKYDLEEDEFFQECSSFSSYNYLFGNKK